MMNGEIYKTYPHNPPHLFRPHAIYIVTGGTLYKKHYLNTDDKKANFCNTLFEQIQKFGWDLEAWAVLSNHYHFVAQAPKNADNLKSLIQSVHSISAKSINALNGTPGRQIWYNYWDTCITYETSYLARLHYVHTNPKKHGIAVLETYQFCSYQWFIDNADPTFSKRVFQQPCDKVRVFDDF